MGTIHKEKEWCARPLQDENVSGNFPRCYQRAEKDQEKKDVQSWITIHSGNLDLNLGHFHFPLGMDLGNVSTR